MFGRNALFRVLCAATALSRFAVEATVTIVQTEQSFSSKPDGRIGSSLWKGYQYLGHLQVVNANPYLCGKGTWSVVTPNDAIPVALMVKKGGCSIEEKARVASTQIHPKGLVKYIIVDGEKSLRATRDADVADADASNVLELSATSAPVNDMTMLEDHPSQPVEDEDVFASSEAELDDGDVNDDESTPLPFNRLLRRHKKKKHSGGDGDGDHKDDITVAVLHVSDTSGYVLLDILMSQSEASMDKGGPKVILDSDLPDVSHKTIMLWVMLSATFSACACCCLLFFLRAGLLDEPQPPPRPRRRRLTNQQVRESYPPYPYSVADCPCDGNMHECSICLDEFEPGVRMRKLPCDHTFHANCIARWLVERSATCPLCKIDLFEDEEEPEETGQDAPTTNGAAQATAGAATTDMYVPAWLARRLAMVEQQAPNQQQESPSWWQRTFSRTSAPRGATAAAAASAETITETVPSAEATTTTTPAAAATTEVEPSSWFGRIFFPTAGTQPGPALTELTEPLLQNEGEALPADPQAEEMPGLTPTQAEV